MLELFTKKAGNRGFTLIELLVVIAIIGILSSIVVVSMGGARAKARDAVRKADMRSILSAEEAYFGDNDKYLQSAAVPTAIGTYLVKVPTEQKTGQAAYGWLDNTDGSSVTKDGTRAYADSFCSWATLETSPVTYAAASHAGSFTLTAVPTTFANCHP